MPLTFGSLFAGIGGFDLGFERCGMNCKWQVEIDDYATRILERHWPDVHRERNIKQCGRHNLEWVDVICGGFPCQDISYAGKGAGLDGERSGLFFEAVRVVRELRPRAVVLENVAGLLTRGLDRVLGTLAEIGFDAEWHCIPAAAVGAPHIRDRVFILAYRNSEPVSPVNAKVAELSCGDVANNTSDRRRKRESHQGGCNQGVEARQERGLSDSSAFPTDTNIPRLEGQRQVTRRTFAELRDVGDQGWWAVEPDVGRVAHGVPNRVDRLRCLGNAIVPQVAEVVGKILLERIGGNDDNLLRH